jgi:hypothetical protein
MKPLAAKSKDVSRTEILARYNVGMSLHELWLTAPQQLREKHVQQIIAFAGEGKLLDGATASHEFRRLLASVPSQILRRYADECLAEAFPNCGLALQDVVNEVGRRLGFSVTPGRYRGVSGQIGFDGIWLFPDGHGVVIEVKKTLAYRIDLKTVVKYRRELIEDRRLAEDRSSILVIVGPQDTEDLEAQIRGSRQAWDIRVISIEALFRLLSLKEELEDPETVRRIHAILIPREFTRLDDIVDLVFSTAEDVKQEEELADDSVQDPREEVSAGSLDVGPKFVPVAFHEACVARIQSALRVPLVRESRATFATPDRSVAVVCIVSKEHDRTGTPGYWFAFHPHQKTSLESSQSAYVAFGCGSPDRLLLIPFEQFSRWLDGMNITERPDRMYWHVKIGRDGDRFILGRRTGAPRVDLTQYLVARETAG